MTGPERVVLAFAALGKARQSAALPERQHLVAPSGENFMGITLVTDVPNQAVIRGIENMMQGDRKLDNAQRSAKVPARDGDHAHGLAAHFIGQLA